MNSVFPKNPFVPSCFRGSGSCRASRLRIQSLTPLASTFAPSRLAVVVALAVVLFAASGCDEVQRSAFGGLIGTVGYPPVKNCEVEVYDALAFRSLDDKTGIIAATRTDSVGRFAVEFSEHFLGRPLIVVARPGPTAIYRDFGAPGAPDVSFDAPRQPWVGVLAEWLGGEDTIAVNPITTAAFHALMRLPSTEIGGGGLRFDREVVFTLHAAVAANFGIKSDPATELPAPPGGPEFVPAAPNFLEDNNRATAYTYACLQLAKAANEFCNTTPGADNALDFYEAMFEDARDGALDGLVYGVPQAYLNQVPAVVGRSATGVSRLFTFVNTSVLTPTEQSWAGAARGGGFDPAPTFMLDLQALATGACRPTRVDYIDVWNMPFSGNLELTVRGAGFRASDWFVIRSQQDGNQVFIVDRNAVGVDGVFNYHSDSEWRIRLPDLGVTTKSVGPNLRVATGANFAPAQFELLNKPEMDIVARQVQYILSGTVHITNRSEPLLIHAAVGRAEVAAFAPANAADCDYDAATDPAALTPGTDRVYELRVRVCNPGPDAVNGLTLDPATTLAQLGNAIVADSFSGTAPGRAFILPDTLPVANMNAGDVATLAFRFVWLDTAFPADIALGAPVIIRPVLSGTSAGAGNPVVSTDNVPVFTSTVSVAPALSGQTALLNSATLTAPATVTQGDTFEVLINLATTPAGAGPARDFIADAVDITLSFGGPLVTVRARDSFFAVEAVPGVVLETLIDAGGARALPMLVPGSAMARTMRLRIRTQAGMTGTILLQADVRGHDAATGTPSSATGNAAVSVTP